MHNDSFGKKAINFLLALAPILSIYYFLSGVTLGEFIIGICAFFSLFFKKNKSFNRSIYIIFAFVAYSFVISIASFVFHNYEFEWLTRLLRFFFYCICIYIISSRGAFDKKYFFKYAGIISIFVFIGMLFQYFTYYTTHSYFKLFGNILPVYSESRMSIDYENVFDYSFFRPSSFFTEPAHLCQFVILPLAYFLFNESDKKFNLRIPIIVCCVLSIVLSTSLWGYSLFAIVLVFFVFRKAKRIGITRITLFAPLLVVFVVILVKTPFFKNSISRLNIDSLLESQTFIGRFGGYDSFFSKSLGTIIFGSGFGNIGNAEYANSVVYILYGTGIIGIVFWLTVLFFNFFKNPVFFNKLFLLLFFVLMPGSGVLISTTFVLFFICIINKSLNDEAIKYETVIKNRNLRISSEHIKKSY